MARWHSANVLQAAGDKKRLWQFTTRGETPSLSREETKLPAEALPARLISKDWQTLYQPKLNIAWLPAHKVFLRVVQLPPADNAAETLAMLELQLEKLSPLPVAQVVWTCEMLPSRKGEAQTAVIVVAPRNLVEEFLGKLEGQSYLADRLEVPFLDQLLSTKPSGDGVWIYPGAGADTGHCIIAWWYSGLLQNLTMLHLPAPEERAAFLREQIAQMTWAGELEGWLTGSPGRHLVADSETAAVWLPLLQEGTDQRVDVTAPLPDTELAKLTARRAARENAATSLVPPEYTARYRQAFVDRIWMRCAFAVAMLYLLGVFVYLALVQYKEFQVTKVEQQARGLSGSYTNALRFKDQVRVMQDQLNLQFAALDCYKTIAQQIPEGITLDGMNFQKGRTINVYGTASKEALGLINDFSDKIRRATLHDQPMFKNVETPRTTMRGEQVNWNFTAELVKGESE